MIKSTRTPTGYWNRQNPSFIYSTNVGSSKPFQTSNKCMFYIKAPHRTENHKKTHTHIQKVLNVFCTVCTVAAPHSTYQTLESVPIPKDEDSYFEDSYFPQRDFHRNQIKFCVQLYSINCDSLCLKTSSQADEACLFRTPSGVDAVVCSGSLELK